MEFVTDIQGPLRINYYVFGDPLTFPVAPPASQRFHFYVLTDIFQTSTRWIGSNFCTDFNGSQTIYSNFSIIIYVSMLLAFSLKHYCAKVHPHRDASKATDSYPGSGQMP